MKIQGIRILDTKDGVVSVCLSDILKIIPHGESYQWSLLFIDGTTHPEYGKRITLMQKQIKESACGVFIKWKDLITLSDQFFQLYEITLMGARDQLLLHRYATDKEMYEACDIVIEMIDCAYWEVHCKDKTLLTRYRELFEETKEL